MVNKKKVLSIIMLLSIFMSILVVPTKEVQAAAPAVHEAAPAVHEAPAVMPAPSTVETSKTTVKTSNDLKPQVISLSIGNTIFNIEEGKNTNVRTTVTPADAQITYSSSDTSIASVSSSGIITSRRSGTAIISITATKQGYIQATKQVYVTVKGLKDLNMIVEPKLLIMHQGDNKYFVSNLGNDTQLTYTISNPNIINFTLNGTQGSIKAKDTGQTTIDFIANKSGYRPVYARTNVVVLENNYVSSNIIKQVTANWYTISVEDKNTRTVREDVVKDAETIISSLSTRNIKSSNNTVILDRATLESMLQEAKKLKIQLNDHIQKVGITPSRGINLRLNASADVKAENDKIYIQFDKSTLTNLNGVDYVYIYLKEYGITVGIDNKTLASQFAKYNSIKIEIEKDGGTYYIKFIDENEKEIKILDQNILLILPVIKGNPYQNSIFVQNGQIIDQLGGSYDAESNGVAIQTKTSGKYYVAENNKTYADIKNKDEEMKQAIEFLASKGILESTVDGRYNPDGILTRAEFTAMVVKSFYALDKNQKASFKDVKASDWYYQYVASSQKEKIILGFDGNVFKPNDKITKEQVAAIVNRALVNQKKYTYPQNPQDYLNFINDNNKVSNWAKKDVALAIKERMIEIPNDFMLNPQGGITRGEAARTLYRMHLKLY